MTRMTHAIALRVSGRGGLVSAGLVRSRGVLAGPRALLLSAMM